MLEFTEDGFEDIRLETQDGVVWEGCLDVWENYNLMLHILHANKDKPPHETYAAFVEHLQKLGAPRLSHHTAVRIYEALANKVKSLKNVPKGESLPVSPASTDSRRSA